LKSIKCKGIVLNETLIEKWIIKYEKFHKRHKNRSD